VVFGVLAWPIGILGGRSKSLGQTRLLENSIRCVSRFDFAINDKAAFSHGAIPNLMVPFTLTFEVATRFEQNCDQGRRK
jgi:hypothetical protein